MRAFHLNLASPLGRFSMGNQVSQYPKRCVLILNLIVFGEKSVLL